MGLLNNYSIINCALVGKTTGGITDLFNKFKPSGFVKYAFGDHGSSTIAALPTGTEPPYSFVMAIKGGELTSATGIVSQGTLSAGLTNGININTQLDGTGVLNANMSLITQMASTLMGIGGLSASMVGTIQMAANLAGQGDMNASIGLISNLAANLIGSGTIVGTMNGKANMSATIYVNQSEATVQQIVDGVWDGLSVDYNNPNTMGELLNSVGAGANPWTVALEGSYTAQDIMRILVAVAAGKTTITDLGGGNATVVFRDLNDTINKVEADMSGSERTNINLNL